jgi:hypothetical protein
MNENRIGDEKTTPRVERVDRELTEEELEKVAGGASAAGNVMATKDAAAQSLVEGDAASDAEKDSESQALRNAEGDDA